MGLRVSCVVEVCGAFGGRVLGEDFAAGVRDRFVASRSRLSQQGFELGEAWILERSATGLREADLNVLSKLGNQGLEGRLEPEAFSGGEVGREDDLLDILVGCPVDIQVARQPST